ncbi:MAG: NADH-quinone oxidoreductase subunit NuoE [Chloroflexi bacterium]|nr:NADH-quinone oxidoreductase subunit NuoE [Chloroflexota bacterium]
MFSPDSRAELDQILKRYPDKRSAILPTLYLAQRDYGYLTPKAMQEVAELLELDPTEVNTVAAFYTLFYREPVGKFVIQVCEDLPCALCGAEKIVSHLRERLGIEVGETTADGLFTLQTVMCVAGCDRAPVMQVNLKYFEGLTPESVDKILEELRSRSPEEEK